jgi:amino acid adenylation domain-containing protein
MSTASFLKKLDQLGVKVQARGGNLRCQAPRGVLTAEIHSELADRKAEILAYLLRNGVGGENDPSGIERARGGQPAPLSFAQHRLWFLDQLEPGNPFYNLPEAARLSGGINITALEQTLGEILRRHEILRTRFPGSQGEATQIVTPPAPVRLPVIDLGRLPAATREAAAIRLAKEEARRPFDLASGPVFRARLLDCGETDPVLLLTIHHIASDGWSVGVLLRETINHYEVFSDGGQSRLPELAIQYSDYACWQRHRLQEDRLAPLLAYWKKHLEGAPALLELPTDRPRPPIQTYCGLRESIELSPALTKALKDLSRSNNVTLYVVLLAAFQALLYRYSGQEDLCVGSPVAARNRIEIETLIGVVVNILVMRGDLSGDPTFRELLRRTREITLAAYAHQDLPFEKLVEELQPRRNLSYSPLFQVMLNFQNAPIPPATTEKLKLTPLNLHGGSVLYDLTLTLVETGRGVSATLEYNTDLFEAATIAEMLQHFSALLESASENPDRPVSRLPLLTESQRRRASVEWNNTARPYPDLRSVEDLFEEQAKVAPDAVAVLFDDQHVTYSELDARANQLAHCLRGAGVGPESLVGIFLERSVRMAIAALGALKAGGAYLPIDPAYPKERIEYVMENSRTAALITEKNLLDQAPHGVRTICLDLDQEEIGRMPVAGPVNPALADNLAYVIYTSGSTGLPKGVQITRRSLVNLLRSMGQRTGIHSDDVFLAVTTLSFDIATCELFLPLLEGALLVISSREQAADGKLLAELIDRSRATMMQATPATWRMLVDAGWDNERGVKVLCGGEALPRDLATRLLEGAGSVWNFYGPTETTIWSTAQQVLNNTGTISIGRPIANTEIYLLDANLLMVPMRAPGELYIGGDGVGRGYLGRPDLTAERFVPDAFGRRPAARLYRTGDLARYFHDGRLEYLGRLDHQVKLRGFRVELGEIESALNHHPNIRQSVAVMRVLPNDEKCIVVYLVSDEDVNSAELRRFLRERLPEYMIPSFFVRREALPLTPNGKVNRAALPDPEWSRSEQEASYVPPRGLIEETLAGLWSRVLKVDRVSRLDNFFELGGHSLLAMRMLTQIHEVFGVDLPVRALFEKTTVAETATEIESALDRLSGQPKSEPKMRKRPGKEDVEEGAPLSFAQQRLWFLDQLHPGNPVYNITSAIRLTGPLNLPAMEQTLYEIVRRHEALRTVFSSQEGRPAQFVRPLRMAPLRVCSLDAKENLWNEELIERLAVAEGRKPFDLERGPLLRALLLKSGDHRHLAIFTMHHIISDGWSMGVLVEEIGAIYEAFLRGQPAPLDDLPIQYPDYAWNQRREAEDGGLIQHLAYWKEQLKNAPAENALPTDFPRPSTQTFRGAVQSFELEADLTAAIEKFCHREGGTLFMALLAAFYALLNRYSRADDLIVGVNIANRGRAEVEKLIGFFVNNLALRINLSGNPTVRELLRRVRRVCIEAYAHQDAPFEKVVEILHRGGELERNPLFQTLFVLHNNPSPGLTLPGMTVEPIHYHNRSAQFELSLNLFRTDSGLTGSLIYSTDLFREATVSRMIEHYRTLLAQMVAGPEREIAHLTLQVPEEAQREIQSFNDHLE